MNPKQRERQNYREEGKYAKVNPCDVCGRSAGVEYFSNPHTCNLEGNYGLILCKKCGEKYCEVTDLEEMRKACLALRGRRDL